MIYQIRPFLGIAFIENGWIDKNNCHHKKLQFELWFVSESNHTRLVTFPYCFKNWKKINNEECKSIYSVPVPCPDL
jgi:hypothetical protein